MQITPGDLNNKALHELFMSAFLPRPIAFVSTIGADGVLNAAPFSSVAPIGLKPALVCFNIGRKGNGQKKDTLKNIESCGEFVVNVVDEALAEQMNQAAADYPPEVDEFKKTGLTPVKSLLVKPPVIGESPVNMECKLKQILEFGEASTGSHVIIGEILLVHVREELWTGIDIDVSKLKPIGRLGAQFYCRTTDVFEMKRPEAKV